MILHTAFEITAYPLLFSLMALWLGSLVKTHSVSSLRHQFDQNLWGILVALAIVVCSAVAIKAEFRTLSDEANLVSVSQSFFETKRPRLVTAANHYYNNFNEIQHKLPIRPLGFAFLTSTLHSLLGYSYKNAFLLNLAVYFFLLLLCYAITKPVLGKIGAMATPIAVAAQPIVAISARSAGFDLLSAFFFFYTLCATHRFLDSKSKDSLWHLLLTLICLCHMRYENILFAFLILGFLIFWQRITILECKSLGVKCVLLPIFLFPMLAQRLLTKTSAYQFPEDRAAFGISNLVQHAKLLLSAFFDFRLYYPAATLLNALVFIFAIIAGFAIWRKLRELKLILPSRPFGTMLVTIFLLYLGIVLSYFFGNWTHPSSARYFIILLTAVSIAFPILLKFLLPKLSNKSLLLFASALFLYYQPLASNSRFMNSLTLNRETRFEYEFLDNNNFSNPLIITERPGHFTIRRLSAIGFAYATKNRAKIATEFQRNLYSDILVFQRFTYETEAPLSEDSLPSNFKLEKIAELQTSAAEFLRISKVVSIAN